MGTHRRRTSFFFFLSPVREWYLAGTRLVLGRYARWYGSNKILFFIFFHNNCSHSFLYLFIFLFSLLFYKVLRETFENQSCLFIIFVLDYMDITGLFEFLFWCFWTISIIFKVWCFLCLSLIICFYNIFYYFIYIIILKKKYWRTRTLIFIKMPYHVPVPVPDTGTVPAPGHHRPT